ncbi:hypothetical protein KGP36_04770 [Patescibacteria group bacterium]|nr:hypothetical protein [Patescibacteria group bacterium]
MNSNEALALPSFLPQVTVSGDADSVEVKCLTVMIGFYLKSLDIQACEVNLSNVYHFTHRAMRQPGIRLGIITDRKTVKLSFTLGDKRLNAEMIVKNGGVQMPVDNLFQSIRKGLAGERDFEIRDRDIAAFLKTGEVPKRTLEAAEPPKPKPIVTIGEAMAAVTNGRAHYGSHLDDEREHHKEVPAVTKIDPEGSVPTTVDEFASAKYRFPELVLGLRQRTEADGFELLASRLVPIINEILGIDLPGDRRSLARLARYLIRERILRKKEKVKPSAYKVIAKVYDAERGRALIKPRHSKIEKKPDMPIDPDSITGKVLRLQSMAVDFENASRGISAARAELEGILSMIKDNDSKESKIKEIDAKIAELEAERDAIAASRASMRGVHKHKAAVEQLLAGMQAIVSSEEHKSAADKLKQLESLI